MRASRSPVSAAHIGAALLIGKILLIKIRIGLLIIIIHIVTRLRVVVRIHKTELILMK